MSIYFPWAFRIPIATTTPHTTPTAKEPELMATVHKYAVIPDSPLIIFVLGGISTWFEGDSLPGIGTSFGISFATADNTGVSCITPKIPRTVVKPKNKDFRFDFG